MTIRVAKPKPTSKILTFAPHPTAAILRNDLCGKMVRRPRALENPCEARVRAMHRLHPDLSDEECRQLAAREIARART
jgi:hypothetical protein